jgi:DNA transposition AAA+ family ATPase
MRKHFVKIENYSRLEQGVAMLSERGAREASWQLITGRAGEGKTTTLFNWGAACGAAFIAMHPGMSPGKLLSTLAAKLHVTRSAGSDLDDAIGQKLLLDQVTVILDEAHNGLAERAASLEGLRSVTDKSGTPVLLVTMETEVGRFDEHLQLSSRIFNWVEFLPTGLEDVAKVCKSLAEVPLGPDLVQRIAKDSGGQMRGILNAISRVEMAAKGIPDRAPDAPVTAAQMKGVRLVEDYRTGHGLRKVSRP